VQPSQLPILNEVFTPTEGELGPARRVAAEYEAALADPVGAIIIDGAFVGQSYYDQAESLLA
jgi:citrate lyase beta subunit